MTYIHMIPICMPSYTVLRAKLCACLQTGFSTDRRFRKSLNIKESLIQRRNGLCFDFKNSPPRRPDKVSAMIYDRHMLKLPGTDHRGLPLYFRPCARTRTVTWRPWRYHAIRACLWNTTHRRRIGVRTHSRVAYFAVCWCCPCDTYLCTLDTHHSFRWNY